MDKDRRNRAQRRADDRARARTLRAATPEPAGVLMMRCQSCGHEFEAGAPGSARPSGGGVVLNGADANTVISGNHFGAGFTIGPASGFSLSGNSVGCPRPGCGGAGVQMVDGAFDVDEDGKWAIVRAVQPPGITVGDYERARQIIERGRANGTSDRDIAEDLGREVPLLRRGAELARRHAKVAGAFITAVSLACTLVSAAYAAKSYYGDEAERANPQPPPTVNVTVEAPPVSEDEIARAVDRYLEEQRRPRPGC